MPSLPNWCLSWHTLTCIGWCTNLYTWKLYLETSSETPLGHRSYTLSLPAGLLGPPEGVLFRPPPPPPATPLTLPRLSMTFAPAPPPREEGALGFLAPPPVGRDTAFDDGRCSSERRGRTPLTGRLKTNIHVRLYDLSMTWSIRQQMLVLQEGEIRHVPVL